MPSKKALGITKPTILVSRISQLTLPISPLTDIAFLLKFEGSQPKSANLTGDLGLEALNLGLSSTGTIDLNVDYGVNLGFGINTTNGFYLDTDQTFFDVSAGLNLSDTFEAKGTLGFLQVDANNVAGANRGTGINADFSVQFARP